jgi:hypothetical protein
MTIRPATIKWKEYIFKSKKFDRDHNWYANNRDLGTWYKLSTWCTDTAGSGQWEFLNQQFIFKREEDLLAFRLRWE